MEFSLRTGLKAEIEKIVCEADTAVQFGSGEVRVFATPMMIALMEKAALSAVDPSLGKEYATVGLHVDVSHLSATPVGMKVRATAELVEISGKKLKFRVEAFDETEKIGEGTHERYIIEISKFLARTEKKYTDKKGESQI